MAALTPIQQAEVLEAMDAVAAVLEARQCSLSVALSALGTLFINAVVQEIEAGNGKAAAELRRTAERFLELAAAPADQVRAVADYLADAPRVGTVN